jgi:MFS family permease
VEAYALFLAALLLTGGSLSDLYGRRKLFAVGVVIFSLASMWCGLAPNIRQLILARGLQGAGGALLVPGSLALISPTFPRSGADPRLVPGQASHRLRPRSAPSWADGSSNTSRGDGCSLSTSR